MDGKVISQATSTIFAELALYVMAVAGKYGRQEAFDLLDSAFSQYGTQVGNMLKEQFKGKVANAQDIFGVISPMEQSVGFGFEVVDSAAGKVTAKFTRCPLYEGCQAVGAPHEEFCNHLGLPFVNGISKAINPSAEWKDVQHRTADDAFCLEELTTG
jgi:hypothetical protein